MCDSNTFQPMSMQAITDSALSMQLPAASELSRAPEMPGHMSSLLLAELERTRAALLLETKTSQALAMFAAITASMKVNPQLSSMEAAWPHASSSHENFGTAPPSASAMLAGPLPQAPLPPQLSSDHVVQQALMWYLPHANTASAHHSTPRMPATAATKSSTSLAPLASSASSTACRCSSASSKTSISSQLTSPARSESTSPVHASDPPKIKKVRSQTLQACHALEIYAERPSARPKSMSKRRLAGQVTAAPVHLARLCHTHAPALLLCGPCPGCLVLACSTSFVSLAPVQVSNRLWSLSQLAKKYNVAPNTVRDIWNRRSWAKVTEPLWNASSPST